MSAMMTAPIAAEHTIAPSPSTNASAITPRTIEITADMIAVITSLPPY